MRGNAAFAAAVLALLATPLWADDWTRELEDRADRNRLAGAAQWIRGDSGKWNDEPRLQAAPALEKKPPKLSLDDWCDQLLQSEVQFKSGEDVWLFFRSRQLDDNDRMWIERVARRGDQFEVVACEAVWQGKYFKNFTGYHVLGVNLGKLAPGRYDAKWTIQPLTFRKFDRPPPLAAAWPLEASPQEQEPVVLDVTIEVAGP
jgi:hypothetical protein